MPPRSFFIPPDLRHVTGVLQDRHAMLDSDPRLTEFEKIGLPPLLNEGDIADALGIASHLIFGIVRNKARHYRRFELVNKTGKVRQIESPRTYLKVIQWWILDNILNLRPVPEFVMGFVFGRGPLKNATHHLGATHILNMDVSNFFPSIKYYDVKLIFASMGYNDDVASLLSEICTFNDRLPQGAPTSPMLSNEFCRNLDLEINEFAENAGLKYSRYADDITLSSENWIESSVVASVSHILVRHGLQVNAEKTRFRGPGDRMEVTGFVINENGFIPLTHVRSKATFRSSTEMTDGNSQAQPPEQGRPEPEQGVGVLRS